MIAVSIVSAKPLYDNAQETVIDIKDNHKAPWVAYDIDDHESTESMHAYV